MRLLEMSKSLSHSRINPTKEDCFYCTADSGDVAQRKGDKDARRDHDSTVRRRSQRVEERDVRVRRRGRCHSNIREREAMSQGKGAFGNKRTPRGLQKRTKRNVKQCPNLTLPWHLSGGGGEDWGG